MFQIVHGNSNFHEKYKRYCKIFHIVWERIRSILFCNPICNRAEARISRDIYWSANYIHDLDVSKLTDCCFFLIKMEYSE